MGHVMKHRTSRGVVWPAAKRRQLRGIARDSRRVFLTETRGLRSAGRGLAGGRVLAGVSYAAYVGVTWLRYGHVTPPAGHDADFLLDRFMPAYDVVERHRVPVAAPAEITLAAAYDLDLQQLAIVRWIFRTREIVLRGRPEDRVLPKALLAQMKALGWGVLAEIPGHEIVVGGVTQPWAANVVFHALPPDEFAAFDKPGYVKIAWTLRADSTGPAESVARHETRAIATDPAARARFRWYWSFFSPGMKVIRYMALGHVKAVAERRARDAGPTHA
jgi:hypothetical protein